MKKRGFIILLSLMACIFLLSVSSCAGGEVSEHERRQLYAEHQEYANWLLKLPVRGMILYQPLDFVVRTWAGSQAPPLSVFRVESVRDCENDPGCLLVTVTIEEVLCGEEAYLGKEIKLLYGTGRLDRYPAMAADPQIMVGKRAVGCFSGEEEQYGIYPYMAFYLTEDGRLAHALGAEEEDVLALIPEIPEEYENNERLGYRYTRKTLEQFRADVEKCLAEIGRENHNAS